MSRHRKGSARARGAAARRLPRTSSSNSRLHRPLHCERLEDRRLLAVVTVNTVDDSIDLTDGKTSLREAIFATNTVPGADEIRFDPALFAAGPRTILLTHGELSITDSLTITGPGADLLTIDASGNDPTPNQNNGDGSRVFRLPGSDFLRLHTIVGLTLVGGDVANQGGAIMATAPLTLVRVSVSDNAANLGGGIYATYLTAQHCKISGNVATRGGGIYIDRDSLRIDDSEIRDNVAQWGGGGVYSRASHFSLMNVTITANRTLKGAGGGVNQSYGIGRGEFHNSRIDGNESEWGAGVYWAAFELDISSTHFSANHSLAGGALYLEGLRATIINSAISENHATAGGGVYVSRGNVYISASTIVDNASTGSGGGLYTNGSGLLLENSTVSRNTAVADGGGIWAGGQAPHLINVVVANNRATNNGGGVFRQGAADTAGLSIVQGHFYGNTAGIGGGAIHNRLSSLLLEESAITGNTAGLLGGGVHLEQAPMTVIGGIINRNTALRGGGLYARNSTFTAKSHKVTITGATIRDNTATNSNDTQGRGGGIYIQGPQVATARLFEVRSSTITGNVTVHALE